MSAAAVCVPSHLTWVLAQMTLCDGAEFKILVALAESGENPVRMSHAALAKRTGESLSTVNRKLRSLETKGMFAHRCRGNPTTPSTYTYGQSDCAGYGQSEGTVTPEYGQSDGTVSGKREGAVNLTVPTNTQNQQVTPPQANGGRIGNGKISFARSKIEEPSISIKRTQSIEGENPPIERSTEGRRNLESVRRQHGADIAKLEGELRKRFPDVTAPLGNGGDPIAAQLIQAVLVKGRPIQQIYSAIDTVARNREGRKLGPVRTWGYPHTAILNNMGIAKIPPQREGDYDYAAVQRKIDAALQHQRKVGS